MKLRVQFPIKPLTIIIRWWRWWWWCFILFCLGYSGGFWNGHRKHFFFWSTVGHTHKPFIKRYNGLWHSPNALQQLHPEKAYIYNHTLTDALYMYVYVHERIYVYIHRYSCYGLIYVLTVYKCSYGYICISIYAVFLCVCVCENERVRFNLKPFL